MTTETAQNPICQLCVELGYAYRDIYGKCTWSSASKEANPGGKLPECREKE